MHHSEVDSRKEAVETCVCTVGPLDMARSKEIWC